jgi:hypothetical protein
MMVLEIASTLKNAALNPRVIGLVLAFNDSVIEHRTILTGRMSELHLGMGVLGELRDAIGMLQIAKMVARIELTTDALSAEWSTGR